MLAYTYYRAEIFFQGERSELYFKYYIISFASISFFLVLHLFGELRNIVITITTSLVVSLYSIESVLRIFEGDRSILTRQAIAVHMGVDFDKRTKLEVINDLINNGVDAVPVIRPRDVLKIGEKLLPLGGISKVVSVGENENGRRMVYLSDRYGFNNPDYIWDSEQVEYLLTGDSFSEGVAVQPGEDMAGQLRLITKRSAINLGRSGNGPLSELAIISEYAPIVKPKKVLWIYYEDNDLRGDLKRERGSTVLMKYLDNDFSQKLIDRQNEIDKILRQYLAIEKTNFSIVEWMLLGKVRELLGLYFGSTIKSVATVDVSQLFSRTINEAKNRVKKWNGRLYFVYLPEYARYTTKVDHNLFRKKSKVIDLVRGFNIPVIDIHKEVFIEHDDPISMFPLRINGHYNSKGYANIAKAIALNIKNYED